MKKLFIILLSLCMTLHYASAQNRVTTEQWVETAEGTDETGHYITETTYEKGIYSASGKWKKWTATAMLGTQFYLGDNDWKGSFLNCWSMPSIDLYMNKWISPNFGLGAGFTYSAFSGLYQFGADEAAFKTDEYYGVYKGKQLYHQRGHSFNPYVITLVDIDNVISGYNPDRFMNLALYAGGGVIFGNDPIQTRCGATYNMGFFTIFHVYKNIDIVLNLRGSLVSDSFDGESRLTEPQTVEYIRKNIPYDITGGLSAGIVYHLGKTPNKKEWVKAGKTTKRYTDLEEAKEEILSLNESLERVKEENKVLEEKSKEAIVIKEPVGLWYHVQFVIDKWDITNRERVNLRSIAMLINASPDTKFSICGYADVQTATPEHNLMLSKNRVNAVFKVLTEEFGVNPDQLVKDFKGGVDLMFYNDNKLSRCVIIKTLDDEMFETRK